MYADGVGVPQDDEEAAKWYRKAAEQGFPPAQFSLGYMYYRGQGVLQDYVEAVKWFRKVAEQGKAQAQWYLGEMYAKGEGVPQDEVEGYAWFLLANVKRQAGEKISALEEILTVEQMEKGKARAVELQRLIEHKSAE